MDLLSSLIARSTSRQTLVHIPRKVRTANHFATPHNFFIAVPIALKFGWRSAFMFTGALGVSWMLLWLLIARPPFLPLAERKTGSMSWPNPLERRFWAIVFSYALPAIAPGPILTLFSVYLNQGMGVSQADLPRLLWVPPLAWGVGYFAWGWAADRFALDNRRPVGSAGKRSMGSIHSMTASPAITICEPAR